MNRHTFSSPIIYIIALALMGNSMTAQNDSIPAKDFHSERLIIPAALITYGALSLVIPSLEQVDDNVKAAAELRSTSVDDYLQFAPAVAVYGLDFAGVKARHNFRDRTLVMASAHIMMGATVYTVKYTSAVRRPDGSAANSFPSGHTAVAFTGAHILFREYYDVSPWIGIAGYAAGTATGLMRILNRRHWLSDVVAGAGTGIVCAEAGYLLLPLMRRIAFGGDATNVALAPVIGGGSYGLGFACAF
jgi:membrane-associated phospholipid phosphatase